MVLNASMRVWPSLSVPRGILAVLRAGRRPNKTVNTRSGQDIRFSNADIRDASHAALKNE